MKLKCVNVIQSTDKKVTTPFSKGEVYTTSPLSMAGKVIPNEFEVHDALREKRGGGKWIALSRWPAGFVIPGVASFEVVL